MTSSAIGHDTNSVFRLGLGDVEALRELLRICWLDTYSGILAEEVIQAAIHEWHGKENLMRGIKNPRAYYAGYRQRGALLGMVSAGMTDVTTLRIFQLYVHPNHQRKGIGHKLMDAAFYHFAEAKVAVLDVEEGNPKGTAFYRRYGFTYPRKTIVKVGDHEIPCLVGELHLPKRRSTVKAR